MADDPLNDDNFLAAINKIEQENKQLNPVEIPQNAPPNPQSYNV